MQLRTLLTLVVAVLCTIALAGMTWFSSLGLDTYQSQTAESAVRVRANALGVFLTRGLYEEWTQIERIASSITSVEDLDALQQRLDAMEGLDDKVSWVGIAAVDGTVLASTRGMLKGENVAQRPWFQQGLAGPFAGDVHEAVLLAKLLGSPVDDPLRFVDFSAPITNAAGEVVAVLGSHVNWRWFRMRVQESAKLLELDVYIVNREGTIVLSTSNIDERTAGMTSVQAARRGVSSLFVEEWPDGQTYESFTVPDMSYGTMPPFGWGMVARLDPNALATPLHRFRTQLMVNAALSALFVTIGFAIVVGIILKPVRRLISNLLAQSRGEPTAYMREHTRFAEIQTLSEALARMQSHNPKPPGPNA